MGRGWGTGGLGLFASANAAVAAGVFQRGVIRRRSRADRDVVAVVVRVLVLAFGFIAVQEGQRQCTAGALVSARQGDVMSVNAVSSWSKGIVQGPLPTLLTLHS